MIQITKSHMLKRSCCQFAQSYKRYSTSVQYSLFNDNSFQNLVKDLSNSLKDAPKQSSANVREVLNLLRFYESKEDQWNKFAIRDQSTNYTRNMVADIENHSKLLVLVWEPGKQSSIHDHPNTHCFMKILKGQLQEKLYDPKTNENEKLLQRTTTLPNDSVAYITDAIGLHQIKNPTADVAISLHLYVPIIFDQLTGMNSDINRPTRNL